MCQIGRSAGVLLVRRTRALEFRSHDKLLVKETSQYNILYSCILCFGFVVEI